MTFTELFRRTAFRKGKVGHKTIRGDVSEWVGSFRGNTLRLRATIRTRIEGSHFMVSANARLRTSGAGMGGHFIDVEILAGELDSEAAGRLRTLIEQADPEQRPAKIRRRGERLRTGLVGTDAIND